MTVPDAMGLYTTSEVEQRTGVPVTTLRQWERRYGMPLPTRSARGYRLYSARDIAHIEFLRARLAEGISISRAVQLCHAQLDQHPNPPGSTDAMAACARELLTVVLAPDLARAAQLLSDAHARWTVEDVLLNVVQPTLHQVGEAWERGQITVAHEHQASAFLRGRIAQLLELAGSSLWGPHVVAACAPTEEHEIGLLMLTVILRRAGLQVHYLGSSMPPADLIAYARSVQARALLISVTVQESLQAMRAHERILREAGIPLFYGGAYMNTKPSLARELGGTYLGPDARAATQTLVTLLQENNERP